MARTEKDETWRLADELLELARADTAFADLLLQRARELLSPELTEAQYAGLAALDGEVASLTNRIAGAMEAEDWQQVRELTGSLGDLQRTASERAPLRGLAARVYGFAEVLVDPFSPGISGLAGVPERDLPAFRDAAVKRLDRLRAADPAWADLYESRRRALAGLRLADASAVAGDAKASVASLRERARKALVDGDMAQLQQLSAQIMEAEHGAGTAGERASATQAAHPAPDLVQPLGREACDRAARLGLVPHRVESTAEQVRARFRPAWLPALVSDGSGNTVRLSVSVPGDAPEALRETLELLVNRAFVTSAGTRYMPWFGAEDLLVEDFDDPSPDATPTSPLLEALGLPGRRGLARRKIEKALRERGAAVVKDLGLDPRAHRIVCLPVDVYTRLGSSRGWGKQQIWTHFDGYMASKERKLMALVGGDVRFGGLHDLVAVGADYDSDRLFARFAVVQRRRFATW
jgi:hypothetical protein